VFLELKRILSGIQIKQNVEETDIFVFSLLLSFLFSYPSAMAKSDFSYVKTSFFPDFAIALRFSKRKYRSCAQP